MARARNLKPSFFENEYLAATSPHARLLFAGLWCLADREGRLEDRPKRIKAAIFPYEEVDIESLLNELANSPDKFILRYSVNGLSAIQIKNFLKHQTPHIKESDSIIPAPDKTDAKPIQESDKTNTSTRQAPDKTDISPDIKCAEKCAGSSTKEAKRSTRQAPDKTDSSTLFNPLPESLNRNPESLNPSTDSVKCALSVEQMFNIFWEYYPKKVDKKRSLRYWSHLKPTEQEFKYILQKLQLFKETVWRDKSLDFIPNPSTWINGKRWDDEIPIEKPKEKNKTISEVSKEMS